MTKISGFTDFQIRKIPDPVWRAFRHQAITEETSARELVLKALQEYLEKRDVKIHWE